MKYVKRFSILDGVEMGSSSTELTRIAECVKHPSYWELDGKESYGKSVKWLFDNNGKEIQKLLICGPVFVRAESDGRLRVRLLYLTANRPAKGYKTGRQLLCRSPGNTRWSCGPWPQCRPQNQW